MTPHAPPLDEAGRPIRRPSRGWVSTGSYSLALGCLALVVGPGLGASEWRVPGFFLIGNALVLLPGIIRAMKREATAVLADHLLVLVAAYLVYFVLGASMIPFGSALQVDQALHSYYRIDAPLGMRVIAANSIGLGLALLTGSLAGRQWVSKWGERAIRLGRKVPTLWVIAGFLLIGVGSYIYILPTDMGLRPGVVPGVFRTGTQLLLVAVFLSASHPDPVPTWWRPGTFLLVVVQSSLGLLLLNKAATLLPVAAFFAGVGWRLGFRRVMLPGVAVLLGGFLLIGGLVNLGRTIYGVNTRATWSDRTALMAEGLLNPKITSQSEEYDSWARFCYLPPQTAAMDMYDQGRGGDDYKMLGWVFLPRALFPDKPVITESGRDFFYKLTGMETSSTGQGLFVNGYYNLGWAGVVAVGLGVGCILAWTSALALEIYRSRALLWIPMALLGSYMGFRVDGHFLADYWGTFAMWLYILGAGVVLEWLFSSKGARV